MTPIKSSPADVLVLMRMVDHLLPVTGCYKLFFSKSNVRSYVCVDE